MNTASSSPHRIPFDLSTPVRRDEAAAPSTPPPAAGAAGPVTGTTGPGRSTPRLPAWARVLLTMIAMIIAAFSPLLTMLIPGLASPRTLTMSTIALAVVSLAALGAYLLISWALVRGIDRRPMRALGFALTPRAGAGLLAGLGISLAVILPVTWLAQATGIARLVPDTNPATEPLLVVVLAVVLRAFLLQGIGEELLFRGYLLQSLARRPVTAVVVSAVAFGAMHIISQGGQQNALEHVLYLFQAGGFALCAGFLASRLGTVWAAVGIHGGVHVATAVAVALGLIAEGPAVWLLATAAFVAIGIVIAVTTPKRRWAQISERGTYGV